MKNKCLSSTLDIIAKMCSLGFVASVTFLIWSILSPMKINQPANSIAMLYRLGSGHANNMAFEHLKYMCDGSHKTPSWWSVESNINILHGFGLLNHDSTPMKGVCESVGELVAIMEKQTDNLLLLDSTQASVSTISKVGRALILIKSTSASPFDANKKIGDFVMACERGEIVKVDDAFAYFELTSTDGQIPEDVCRVVRNTVRGFGYSIYLGSPLKDQK